MNSTLFDGLAPRHVIAGLEDVQELFRRISSRNEAVLDYFDDHDGSLPDGRDGCIADAESVRENARYGVEVIAKTILWLKLKPKEKQK